MLNTSSLAYIELVEINDRLVVKSYKQHVFDEHEFASGTMVNSDNLSMIVQRFLPASYATGKHISCVLGPSLIDDRFMMHSTLDLSSIDHTLYRSHYASSVEYLYTEDDLFVFYRSHISHVLLLQLQLLFARCFIDCSVIMSYFFPLLQCYKSLHGSAYRRAQLACDMQQSNNNLLSFFSPDIAHRLVDVSHIHVLNEWPSILAACGSFLLYRENV